MKLWIIVWSHKHGIDSIPVFIPDGTAPPDITNAFMNDLGIDNAELDEDDGGSEYAYWTGPFITEQIPILKPKGPIEWEPDED